MFGAARRKEQLLTLLLSVLAAVRVFIFAAAFPFFSNGDEDLHFDLITQYSHAQVPRSFDRLKEETLNWIVPYASPEFLFLQGPLPIAKISGAFWERAGGKGRTGDCVNTSGLEQRDQWGIFPTAAVLHVRGLVVETWTEHRTNTNRVIVLDSFLEWPACLDNRVAWLCYCANSWP